MLELQVDCRLPNHPGDVILARPAGLPWGTQDTREFLIVRRDDPELEQRVLAEEGQVLAYPYAAYDAKGEMIAVSQWRVDPHLLAIIGLSDTTRHIDPVVLPANVWVRVSVLDPKLETVVEEPSLISKAVSSVTGVFSSAWDLVTSLWD